MKRLLDILSNALSIILYPLFVPTYGVALFCYLYSLQVVPLATVWMIVAIIGTFVLTCAIPLSAIWILMRLGKVSNLHIDDAQERTMPFVYAILGFAAWCYLIIAILHAPLFIAFTAVGATTSIAIVALINSRWKISAHLTGLGGLVGGVMCYCLGIGAIPTWSTLAIWMGLSLVLMYARLRLNAHTPAQVCAGWLLGLACTFLPYCIYSYVG